MSSYYARCFLKYTKHYTPILPAAAPCSRDAFVCTRVAPISRLPTLLHAVASLLTLCPHPFHATPSPALQYAVVTHSAPRRRPSSATSPPLLPMPRRPCQGRGDGGGSVLERALLFGSRRGRRSGGWSALWICRLSSSKHRIPVQNLSFSTYGPNNQDNILQGSYQNTKDNAHIQSLPNGEIISFKAREESSGTEDHSILWGLKFNNPIVAIFDVLRNPTHHNTFVLLQPRPQLSAILPKLTHATSMDQLPHLQSAYIGLRWRSRVIKVIDEGPHKLPSDVDAVTEERKRREKAMKERNYGSEDARCLDRSSLYTDRRCLVGIRPLEGGDGDGPENRLKRLIDGAPTVVMDSAVMHWDPRENANTNTNTVPNGNGTPEGAGDKPGSGPALSGNSTLIEGREPAADDLSFWPSIVFASAPVIVDVPTAAISALAAPPTPTLPPPEESPPPLSPQVLTTEKLPPLPPDVAEDADESGDENENENGNASALPGTKRKGRRGRRAKKKKLGVVDAGENNNSVDLSSEKENLQENLKPIENGLVVLPNGNSSNPLSIGLVLLSYNSGGGSSRRTLIGCFGPRSRSHGTVVYRGSLQGRAVAVKCLLQDFVTLASRKVSILQESDDHPNVIRYYYWEAHSNFLYIALELCPATLADLIETPDCDAWRDIANIFVSAGAGGGAKAYRMLISYFGLCKKLDVDQTSFLPTSHGAMAAGTVGWRAPEILRGDAKLDEMSAGDDASVSSQGSAASGASSGTAGKLARLTKSVDIFALGCLFFYTLTSGGIRLCSTWTTSPTRFPPPGPGHFTDATSGSLRAATTVSTGSYRSDATPTPPTQSHRPHALECL
ncbi:hypothetical protein B0H14DRAFT_3759804 [Mycena olivaceomarginata]|nr:hypothetical protein B0H14DRAFT_3759804 [Mycena olivaceomarginata]